MTPHLASYLVLWRHSLAVLWGWLFGEFPAPSLDIISAHDDHRYISTGDGKGNPYGLAVVTGVVCPILFFGRLYWNGPPMTNIIFFVTIMLVSLNTFIYFKIRLLKLCRSSDIRGKTLIFLSDSTIGAGLWHGYVVRRSSHCEANQTSPIATVHFGGRRCHSCIVSPYVHSIMNSRGHP